MKTTTLHNQTLQLQEQNILLTKENQQLKYQLAKSQASVDFLNHPGNSGDTPLEPYQQEFLKQRGESSALLNSKVILTRY